jgi:hypothetical protein
MHLPDPLAGCDRTPNGGRRMKWGRARRGSGQHRRVGAAEAAALGNAIVQGLAIGSFGSLDEGRAKIDVADTPRSVR